MKGSYAIIFGIPVSRMGMRDTVRYLTDAVLRRQPHQVVTINPIMVMDALKNPGYMAMMKQADLIVPDGAGVVWAASYTGQPVAERVAGFDLMHELLREGEKHGWKAYFLGAAPGVIEQAVQRLQQMYPGIRVAGYRDGFFGPEQDDEVIADIRDAEPDLLFVARSASNQDTWIGQYRSRLNVPVMMGVGGSFDIIAGKLKRAPYLFRKLRLEWLYRLLQEPWRYKRMLALPQFVVKVIREKENVTKRG